VLSGDRAQLGQPVVEIEREDARVRINQKPRIVEGIHRRERRSKQRCHVDRIDASVEANQNPFADRVELDVPHPGKWGDDVAAARCEVDCDDSIIVVADEQSIADLVQCKVIR